MDFCAERIEDKISISIYEDDRCISDFELTEKDARCLMESLYSILYNSVRMEMCLDIKDYDNN